MLVFKEGVGRHVAEVGADATNRQVHLGQLVGGAGLFLTVDRDVFFVALMAFNKFDRLYKHAAGAAAGVIDFAMIRLDHFGQQVNHAFGGVKLAAAFAFSGGEVAEEVFVNATDDVFFAGGFLSCAVGTVFTISPHGLNNSVDIVDAVDQRRQLADVEAKAREVVIRQRTAQGWVVFLDDVQGGVDFYRDVVLLGVLGDVLPAAVFRQVEGVGHGVKLHHVDIVALSFVYQLLLALIEFVADEFEEDQRQHHVFVFGGLHRATQFVGGGPERLFKGLGFRGVFFSGLAGHEGDSLGCTEKRHEPVPFTSLHGVAVYSAPNQWGLSRSGGCLAG